MTQNEQALAQEFIRLRHGWGLTANHLRERTGPHLIDLCGIRADDNDRVIRTKVLATVASLTSSFSRDDRLAIDIALGAVAGTQHRLLASRVALIALRLNCSERTARRRVDRAFEQLTEEAVAQRTRAVEEADDDPEKGWYVRKLDALLRLDTPTPEVSEARTIVARRAGLKKIAIRFSLPARDGAGAEPRNLHADIAHGATIESMERIGEAHFRLMLALPRALARDEEHTYTIVFRLPPGQPMRRHYALIPFFRVDTFHVRVRFDPHRLPLSVRGFDQLAPRTLDDREIPGEVLPLDNAHEVETEFVRMERSFAYGVAWTMPADD